MPKVKNVIKDLWESLNGKKTNLGSYATTLLVGLDVLDKIITNPALHSTIDSIAGLVPSWGIYATTSLAAFGAVHKIIKAIRG